ncbi:hypothetical protein HK405_009873 [Cladochytrium tenue]|nr:hypothetical protein HK405_009873 [Cladochytrium tenue]
MALPPSKPPLPALALDVAGPSGGNDDGGTGAVPVPLKDDSKTPYMLPIKELLRLVQIGEVDEVKKWILEKGSNGKWRVKEVVENMRGPEEETLLHFAILRNEAVANILAKYGSCKFLAEDYKNDRYRGETALHLAVVQKRKTLAMAIGYEFVQGQKHKGALYAGMTALQEDSYGNNVFHILAMKKNPSLPDLRLTINLLRKCFIRKSPEIKKNGASQTIPHKASANVVQSDSSVPRSTLQNQETQNLSTPAGDMLPPTNPDTKKNGASQSTPDKGKAPASANAVHPNSSQNQETQPPSGGLLERGNTSATEYYSYTPAGELGAPVEFLKCINIPNMVGLTPSQIGAYFDNAGFLEMLRLKQWRFGDSSSSIIRVEHLTKPSEESQKMDSPIPPSSSGASLPSSSGASHPTSSGTSPSTSSGASPSTSTGASPSTSSGASPPTSSEPSHPFSSQVTASQQEHASKTKGQNMNSLSRLSPLEIAASRRCLNVTGHPLVMAIYKIKWLLYARNIFLFRAIFNILYVAIFTATLAIQPSSVPGRFTYNRLRAVFEVALFAISIMYLYFHVKGWSTSSSRTTKVLFCVIINITFVIRIGLLVAHRDHFCWTYSYDLDSAASSAWTEPPDLASSLIGWLQFENIFLGLACIFGWWSILYFAKASQTVGELFLAFKLIFKDIITWSALFFIICLAFSGTFFLQMQSSGIDQWSPYWWSMLWMIRITLQEGTFDSFADGAIVPALAILLFIAFSFLMVIVLINLLIAKSADTFQKIHENTRKNWRVDFANLILDIDRMLPPKKLEIYDAHIGFKDLVTDTGRYLTFIEMNGDDGQPDMVKAVVGYWDSRNNLDGLPPIEPFFPKVRDYFKAQNHAEAAAESEDNFKPPAQNDDFGLQGVIVHNPASSSTPPPGSASSNTVSDQNCSVDTAAPSPPAAAKGNGINARPSSENAGGPRKSPVEIRINGGYWKDWHRGLAHHAAWILRRADLLRKIDKNQDMNLWLHHPHVVAQFPLIPPDVKKVVERYGEFVLE